MDKCKQDRVGYYWYNFLVWYYGNRNVPSRNDEEGKENRWAALPIEVRQVINRRWNKLKKDERDGQVSPG